MYAKLTKIVYILLLACFFWAQMPEYHQECLSASSAIGDLDYQSIITPFFEDSLNDIEEAEEAELGEYKKLRKNKKPQNICLSKQLSLFAAAPVYSDTAGGRRNKSGLASHYSYELKLQSVILLL